MKTAHFLAFDLGATSGRSILGTLHDGSLEMKELTRFPNAVVEIQGKYYWNIFSLFEHLKEGLHAAHKEQVTIDGIGIDTWGVDFVYVGEDGSILGLPRAYRDPYTDGIPESFFKLIPRQEVYELTGTQIMNFNSLYQLFAANQEQSSALKAASSILFMPDALSYLLTGRKVCEYTIASTSQLLNPRTQKLEERLLHAASIPPALFPPIIPSGTEIGVLSEALALETNLGAVPVIAVAGHDTASAIAAIPADNAYFAYLSSGTWSLMGIEVKEPIITPSSFELNFTNEGGVDGTTRFLKNVTGMWLLEQCIKEWKKEGRAYTYPEIVELSKTATPFQSLIDSDDPTFAHPEHMTQAIQAYCKRSQQTIPTTDADFIRCIFESLALKYHWVLEALRSLAPFPIEKLHVIGGGAQNKLLNQFTANSIGIPVVSGPSEATGIGNIMMQAKAKGCVKDLHEMRQIIKKSIQTETFLPQDTSEWKTQYQRFLSIIQSSNKQ